MSAPRRVLPADRDGPRFRLVRLWRVDGKIKAEIIGSADEPQYAITSVMSEGGRVLAVDRRGFVYCENGKPIANQGEYEL